MDIKPRSIFDTGTVKSAFWGFGLTAIALAVPYVSTIAQRYATDKATKDTIADVAGMLSAVLGASGVVGGGLGVIANRATANLQDIVYSPSFIPGLNKDEAINVAQQKIDETGRLAMVQDFVEGKVDLPQLSAVKDAIAYQASAAKPNMHEQIKQLQQRQRDPADFDRVVISRAPEGVAVPPIDLGLQRQVFTNPQDAI